MRRFSMIKRGMVWTSVISSPTAASTINRHRYHKHFGWACLVMFVHISRRNAGKSGKHCVPGRDMHNHQSPRPAKTSAWRHYSPRASLTMFTQLSHTLVESIRTNKVRCERVSKHVDKQLDNLYARQEAVFVPVDRLLDLLCAIDSVRPTPPRVSFEVVARW